MAESELEPETASAADEPEAEAEAEVEPEPADEIAGAIAEVLSLPAEQQIGALMGLPPNQRGWVINALPPEQQALAEATLYQPQWDGPAWMTTNDSCGGFRRMRHFPQFRLAVSKNPVLDKQAEQKYFSPDSTFRPGALWLAGAYPPPIGWRLAASSDLTAAGFGPGLGRAARPLQRYYEGEAGWQGLEWEFQDRVYFLMADWQQVEPAAGGCLYSFNCEGELPDPSPGTAEFRRMLPHRRSYTTIKDLQGVLPKGHFAGVVCVRSGPYVPAGGGGDGDGGDGSASTAGSEG
eukprot:SAG22_NODE_1471_length_4342_cov_3.522036_2_plen_292_part_00